MQPSINAVLEERGDDKVGYFRVAEFEVPGILTGDLRKMHAKGGPVNGWVVNGKYEFGVRRMVINTRRRIKAHLGGMLSIANPSTLSSANIRASGAPFVT